MTGKPPASQAIRVEFGQRLRKARLEVGMTQVQLAAAAGINAPHLSEIERGCHNITLETMVGLADAAGLRVTVRITAKPKSRNPS
jgi:HTH-type transcriptional regulator / antitoxin HipB